MTSSSKLKLSVVSACLNEQEILHEFISRTDAACKTVAEDSYEIILVNDGSTDATLEIMKAAAQDNAHLVIINLSRRFGHQAALTAGLFEAQGDRILILDSDLQDPPELLTEMSAALDEGADIAFGQRTARDGESWFKKASASLFYWSFSHLTSMPMPENAGDFRLMSRRAVDKLNAMPERSRFLRGMTSWIGLNQKAIPYHRAARASGTTKYPLRKMLHFALDAITSFSTRPLRIASYGGALCGVFGLGLLIYVLHAWVMGHVVPGWTSLMVVVLLIGGVQLLCLGVFGEYLGRLYIESKQRPLFIIESIIREEKTKI
ncbi:MAG: glycosyltransferase family 2 protein [Bdellovibrionales bacterium]